jgi:hypothetical protein
MKLNLAWTLIIMSVGIITVMMMMIMNHPDSGEKGATLRANGAEVFLEALCCTGVPVAKIREIPVT